MKLTIRTKLLFNFLFIVVITSSFAALIGIQLLKTLGTEYTQTEVLADLNATREIYQKHLEKVKDIIRLTAIRFFIKDDILKSELQLLENELLKIRKSESLDILSFIDKNGIVIFHTHDPKAPKEDYSEDPLIKNVLQKKSTIVATEMIEDYQNQDDNNTNENGMMIKAAAPILDDQSSLIGVLFGGVILNNKNDIVDEVQELIFRKNRYKGKLIGTANVLQGNKIISTSLEFEDGNRSIGETINEKIVSQVMCEGKIWNGRTNHLNNWYTSAFSPITDFNGNNIGMLGISILEAKYRDSRKRTIFLFIGILFIGVFVAALISYYFTHQIDKPIKKLVLASQKIANGDLDFQVTVKTSDEIGLLGKAFNKMASSLKERDKKLQEKTQQTIMQSDRLATVGQLAAGVAHEINNPLGGILVYSHLLLEDTSPNDPGRENLEKIIYQAKRCKKTIKGLLDFSRQSEPDMELSNINEIVNNVFGLLESHPIFREIKIIKQLSNKPLLTMLDKSQFEQVFINIIMNAAEAIKGKGQLILETSRTNEMVVTEFTDTGCGIQEENLEKLFDPFFSTKEVGQGTGLGLAISYGIIERHNGNIEVTSKVGVGTTFLVKLPIKIGHD